LDKNIQYNTLDVGNHIIGLDCLKVLAIFAVVWVHGSDMNKLAKSLRTYCVFAVPCFVIMSAFLMQLSYSKKTDRGYLDLLYSRFKRLVPAYLVWSVLYLIFRFIKRKFVSDLPIDFDLIVIIFCGGASYQLWFVPVLLVLTSIFTPLIIFTTKRDNGNSLIASLFVLVVFMLWADMKSRAFLHFSGGYAIFDPINGLSGYFILGIGLWLLFRKCSIYTRNKFAIMSVGISFLLLALILPSFRIEFSRNLFILFYSLLLFVSFFLIFLYIKWPFLGFITKFLAPCSFGIFLCHGIFVEGFQIFINIAGIDNTTFVTSIGVILASYLCSAVLCIALRIYKVTRWLVV
jgi:surface polysaccharide O-acyltransferase-like enzyme